MRLLVFVLLQICRISGAFPRTVIAIFLVAGVAGFSVMPFVKISPSLVSGMAHEYYPITYLTIENSKLFGDEDVLTVVLEFKEPRGEVRLPLIVGLAQTLETIPGVSHVRYRYFDLDDEERINLLLKHFLLSLGEKEQEQVRARLSPDGLRDALRRNTNRLWLTYSPSFQKRILEDPLELNQFLAESIRKRLGNGVGQDVNFLFTSPDNTVFLIQVTTDFHHTDVVRAGEFEHEIRRALSQRIPELIHSLSEPGDASAKSVRWNLTGKLAFTNESYAIFLAAISTILVISAVLVMAFLVIVYRSLWSAVILFAPIAAGVGPNYGLIYLSYDEVNPLTMAASGVLFGLGTDYGVHLWTRFVREMDRGADASQALHVVYQQTGPPIFVGALTNILAFLCLCMSQQSGLSQFGYIGATGLCLTLMASLFLFPALVGILSGFKKDLYPRMHLSFRPFSRLFERRPAWICVASAIVIVVSLNFALRISYEEDVFKVFYAGKMDSLATAELVGEKFHSNFAQPLLLSFDVNEVNHGVAIQRKLDHILERFMETGHEISSFDSVSHIMIPDSVRRENIRFFSHIASNWPELEASFDDLSRRSSLSPSALDVMRHSLDRTGKLLKELGQGIPGTLATRSVHEESARYIAPVGDKLRFVTTVICSDTLSNPDQMKKVEDKLLDAVKALPVKVDICGPRPAMEEVGTNLLAEIKRLGLYVFAVVLVFFLALFRHPAHVVLSLIPMAGAFCITLGVLSALGMGLAFSAVAVAPLLFGLGMDNGVHIVMGTLHEAKGSVSETMERVTQPIMFTSLTNVLGFVAMLSSRHYPMEFLAWAMVIGMAAAVALTLTTLPAILLLMERRRIATG